MIFMDTVADACLFHVLGGKKRKPWERKVLLRQCLMTIFSDGWFFNTVKRHRL